MLLLTNTNRLSPKSTKAKKASLWRANFTQLTKPHTPAELAKILPTAYATYCGHISNPKKALSANTDTSEYNKTSDIQPLSPFRTIDIETSTTDLDNHIDYIDPTPKPARLTEEEIFQRLKPYAHTTQYSDSHISQKDIRLHTHLCFNRNVSVEQSWSLISSLFPETCIPNYKHNLRCVAFNLSNYRTKPLYIDIVSKRPKQKMYVADKPFASNKQNDLISLNKAHYHTDNLDTNPTNLIRQSLVNAYIEGQVQRHGTLEKAKAHYLEYGDSIPSETLIYDQKFNLMGTAEEVINNPNYYGKNCNYGANPDWYNPTYRTNPSKRAYLQVAEQGGYIVDHVEQCRVQFTTTHTADETLISPKQYIGNLFDNVLDSTKHIAYGLIASTGSGKTTSFKNSPYHILLVPQNKQVKSQEGFTVLLSEEQSLNVPNRYTSIGGAIEDGHTSLVMTYDKFAGYVSKTKNALDKFTIICDEIHEFLLSASAHDSTRDQLFQSFRTDQYKRIIFMSATLKPNFFKDIREDMHVVEILTEQIRPRTIIMSGLDYKDFTYHNSTVIHKGLKSIIEENTKTVVWLNHINHGAGVIADTPEKTSKHIYGANAENPAEAIAAEEPDLLIMTSSVKQGFSINYEVDTYVVYIDPYNNFNTYTMDEIEQITARCRKAKRLIIVVSPRRYDPLHIGHIPSQDEVIEAGIMLREDSRSIEELSAMLMSDYAPLLDKVVVEPEEKMPAFYLSERIILGNRVLASSMEDSHNLTRDNLQINGTGCEVMPVGTVTHNFPRIKQSYNLVSLIKSGESVADIKEKVENEYFPDGILTPKPTNLNTIEMAIWSRFEDTLGALTQTHLSLETIKLVLTDTKSWQGFRDRERIKSIKQLLLSEDGLILSVSTLPRLWNNKDPAIQKLGGAKKMTASRAIKILTEKLHQEARYVTTLEDGTTRDLEELKWSKKNQSKYYLTYKGAKRKDATIGWLYEDTFFKAKKEDDGVYPIGGKVLFMNEGYLL